MKWKVFCDCWSKVVQVYGDLCWDSVQVERIQCWPIRSVCSRPRATFRRTTFACVSVKLTQRIYECETCMAHSSYIRRVIRSGTFSFPPFLLPVFNGTGIRQSLHCSPWGCCVSACTWPCHSSNSVLTDAGAGALCHHFSSVYPLLTWALSGRIEPSRRSQRKVVTCWERKTFYECNSCVCVSCVVLFMGNLLSDSLPLSACRCDHH